MMIKPTIKDIESGARQYAESHRALAACIVLIDAEIDAVRAKHEQNLQSLMQAHIEDERLLRERIEAAPELFESPRTILVQGVKVGLRKGSGGIDIEDEERTIALIEKHLPAQAEVLIHVEKTVVKKALNELDVRDLKMIGCQIESTGDIPVIKVEDKNTAQRVRTTLKFARKAPREGAKVTEARR